MKVKYMNVVYDLNNDFDRKQLEIFARVAGKGESLEEYLLRETGVNIANPASADQPEDYGQRYKQAIERSVRAKQELDKRKKPEVVDKIDMNAPLPEYVTPEALAYYRMKDDMAPKDNVNQSALAEWAANFGDLANKNYEYQVKRGRITPEEVDKYLNPGNYAQAFKDDKMMTRIERITTPASRAQVPEFDGSSMNQNIGIDEQEQIAPEVENFSRNNTNPVEVEEHPLSNFYR